MRETNEQIQQRRNKLNALRDMGVAPFPADTRRDTLTSDFHQAYELADRESLAAMNDPRQHCLAGRIVALRSFGKAAFAKIADRTGTLQCYIARDSLGTETYGQFKKAEIGDIIEVSGHAFRTRTDELSIHATSFTLLTKALRPLPEKWHGLKDVETRYRQRYVDLIVNADARARFILRSHVIRHIREFFSCRGFLEVETPMMHPILGGANAKPFATHHNALDMDLYLRIAPELYLKRLVVGGLERVFEINRNFRNEGISPRHNPEFTMIEWYTAYATYEQQMQLTEELLASLADNVLDSRTIAFGEHQIDLSPPYRRISIPQALTEFTQLDASAIDNRNELSRLAREYGMDQAASASLARLQFFLFEELVEHQLIQPTFIVDYPKEVSPLAKSQQNNPDVTSRFELFIGGIEIANGFDELNDPDDQYERFEAQVRAKQAGDEEACEMDMDYIRALEYGLPPTAGEGLGIDRLVMLLSNAPSIRDVILFPHMRPED